MAKRIRPTYEKEVNEKIEKYSKLPDNEKILSDKVYNDLVIYNAMIDEWANGLLSLKLGINDVNIKNINQKKKKFYWIHWKRGTKGIKHYANMMLDHLDKEWREANGEKVEPQKEGE